MSVWYLAFLFWVILDPIGSVPLCAHTVGFLKPKQQYWVIFREMLIALAILVFILFLGEEFFDLLGIEQDPIAIAGGSIVLLIGLKMIFAKPFNEEATKASRQAPMIIPIAVPCIAGPGIITTIILYSAEGQGYLKLFGAIFIAWLGSLPILLLAPKIKKILGPNGSLAVESLFGFILVLIATQMILNGIIHALA